MMWQQLARLMRKRAVPRSVTLREVGLRDGLHSFKTPLPTLVKFDWVLLGYAAGLREIEVGSFVRPDVLPQMADTAEVVAFAKTVPDLVVSVLVHDRAGARDALSSRCRVEAGIGTAFGCALEGDVAPDKVLRLVQASLDAGVECIGLSDTIGVARPEAVTSLLVSRGVDTGIELARLREFHTFVRKQPDAQGLFDALSQVSSRAASVPFASPR